MKNKRFLAGISGMLFIFGLLVVGCPPDETSKPDPRIVFIAFEIPDTVTQRGIYILTARGISDPEGALSAGVYWEISGQTVRETILDRDLGILVVGPNERGPLTITATSQVDSTRKESKSVRVTPADDLTITPQTIAILPGGEQPVQASMPARWDISRVGGGALNGTTIRPIGTDSLTATVQIADIEEPGAMFMITAETPPSTEPAKTARALVTVLPRPTVTSMRVTPSPGVFIPGTEPQYIPFTTVFTGEAGINRTIAWATSGAVGATITSDGRLTIPANQQTAFTVTATISPANVLAPGVSRTVNVEVKPMSPITSLTLTVAGTVVVQFPNLAVGDSLLLPNTLVTRTSDRNIEVTATRSGPNDASSNEVTWEINDYPSGQYAKIISDTSSQSQRAEGLAPGTAQLTARIKDGTAPGTDYTYSFPIRIVRVVSPIEISWDYVQIPDTTDVSPIVGSLTGSDSVTVTVTASNPSELANHYYTWMIDGETLLDGPGVEYASYPLNRQDFSTGTHYLTVTVYLNGNTANPAPVPYSKEIRFSVR